MGRQRGGSTNWCTAPRQSLETRRAIRTPRHVTDTKPYTNTNATASPRTGTRPRITRSSACAVLHSDRITLMRRSLQYLLPTIKIHVKVCHAQLWRIADHMKRPAPDFAHACLNMDLLKHVPPS